MLVTLFLIASVRDARANFYLFYSLRGFAESLIKVDEQRARCEEDFQPSCCVNSTFHHHETIMNDSIIRFHYEELVGS